jgi:hypothetical protein
VKTCPSCEAELRDSVIRCTRCGRSLLPEREGQDAPARVGGGPTLGAPAVSASSRGSRIGFPEHDAEPPPPPAVWAQPAPARSRSAAERRALPTERRSSARPDFALLAASVVAVAAAVMAWGAIADPWVKLVITDTSEALDPKLVGEITLRGQAALVGIVGQGIAAVIGAYGVLWFLYAFDRGSTMPWFVSPSISILASAAGAGGAILSAVVWFVWEDAAIERARAVRMTVDELRALLAMQPKPLVEIQQLGGLLRFGGAMAVALLAGCTAWWAYRKRG